MKVPLFFAKRGYWGEYGWIKISFLRYLWGLTDNYVLKVRWVKCSKN
jgi:hypothetical protein